jgi:hypothetical protein
MNFWSWTFAFSGVFENLSVREIARLEHAFDPRRMINRIGLRESAIRIIGIHLRRERDLPADPYAKTFTNRHFTSSERRDQKRGKNRDDRTDHEQFYESEPTGALRRQFPNERAYYG